MFEKQLQPRAPLDQWHVAQVQAIVMHQIKQVERDVLGLGVVERVLEGAEVGQPILVEDHDFAVKPARRQLHGRQVARQVRQLPCPVVAVAREEPHAGDIHPRQQSVPVELEFKDPVVARARRSVDEGGELGRNLGGEGGLLGAFQHAGRFGRGGSAGGRREPGHAVRHFVDHAELAGGADVLITLLEQQPGVLLLVLALDPHQRPLAAQLVPA